MVALDVEKPGRVMSDVDIVAQASAGGTPVQLVTVTDWLRREARDPHGAVVRVAERNYVRRADLGPGSLTSTSQVAAAAAALHSEGHTVFSVQALLGRLRLIGACLSQRTVYYAVQELTADEETPLERAETRGMYRWAADRNRRS